MSRIGQNCIIFKILLLFWPFLWKITYLRSLFRVFCGWYFDSIISYYQERVQKAVGFWILCSFDPFCSIPRARLAIFWKYNMFKETFWGFLGAIFWFLEWYLSFNMLHNQEMSIKAVGFWILCSYDTFCSIPWARLVIFWKWNMFKETF